MKKKICVYAICKNESKNILKWYDSMSEADHIIVCDTGSTDNSLELLKSKDIEVHEIHVEPFRFDTARNISLSFVSDEYDICVCTDLDERFNKGWAEEVRNHFDDETTRLSYKYNWSFNEKGEEATTYYLDKIHKNKIYEWVHPVHEVLKCNKEEKRKLCEGIVLNHYQDTTKDRTSYKELLELSVKENPQDDRNMHYLGREYMYYKEYNKAIDTLINHLSLKSSVWKDERCASMRFIARSYLGLNRENEAIMWYEKAIEEAPYLRESYVELSSIYYSKNDYKKVIEYLSVALKIKEKPKTYINESFAWDYHIYDMLSNAYFYTKDLYKSFYMAYIAYELNNDERLKNNLYIIKNAISEKI